jgi:hypothetical protein
MALDVYEDIERCFDGGWSDGLPVIPPYGTLVDKMLDAMGWQAMDIVGEISTQKIRIRAQHMAATAVMAGCRFEYGRLLRALSLALLHPDFNISGVEVTTGGASALVIVGGPIVEELGFEHESNALGANNRANATIGRFAQMVRYFCGRGGGSMHSHGTMGHPGRLSFCITEHPETVWPPFHTQFGIEAGRSAVTVMSTEGPNSVNNHYAADPEGILDTIAETMSHAGFTNWYWHTGASLVVIGPDHMDVIGKSYTREQAKEYLLARAVRPTDKLKRMGRLPNDPLAKSRVVPGSMRSPYDNPGQLRFVECGARGGKFSAVIPGWVGCLEIISKVIE